MPTVLYQSVKKPRKSGPILIGAADEAILLAIHRYYALTPELLAQLLYRPTASGLRYAQRRLKRLVDAGYLQGVDQPKLARYGRRAQVHFLANDGRQYLAHKGIEVEPRSRPESVGKYAFLFFQHTLEANAVGIALEQLARATDRLEVVELRSEHALKRQLAKVNLAGEHAVSVYPDAWYDLIEREATGKAYRTCLALELDRATENQTRWKKKVAALVAWYQNAYPALYGTNSLTICVLTTEGSRRCQHLLDWTAAELKERQLTDLAELFRFTANTPTNSDPQTLFFGPVWYQPGVATPAPLLDVAGGSA